MIDEKEVAGAGDGLIRKVVDLPAARTAGDDGIKGVSFNLLAGGHFRKDDSLKSSLGHPGANLRKDGIEDGFIDLL